MQNASPILLSERRFLFVRQENEKSDSFVGWEGNDDTRSSFRCIIKSNFAGQARPRHAADKIQSGVDAVMRLEIGRKTLTPHHES